MCICLLAIIAFKKKSKLLLFLILIYLFSTFYFNFMDSRNTSQFTTLDFAANCQITDDLKVDGDSFQSVVYCNNEKLQLNYKILTEKEQQNLKQLTYGSFVSIVGTLEEPQVNRNQDQFNYKAYLYRQGINYTIQATTLHISQNKSSSFLLYIKNIRLKLIEHINTNISPKINSYFLALITGDKSGFSAELYEDYQQMGVVHLLAISGLHVNLLIGAIYFVLVKIGITRERTATLLLIFLPFYSILTGMNAPVIRAAMMTGLLLLTEKFSIKCSSFSVISLSFILFFLIRPYVIYEVGFQLSYAVSFGIIISSSIILKKQKHPLIQSLSISLISTMMSSVVMMYHFYSFSWVGIFFNLLYVPIFTIILLPGCFIVLLLSFISPLLITVPETILSVCIQIMEFLTNIFAQLPKQTITTGRPNTVLCCLFILVITLFFYHWQRKSFPKILFSCFICLCYISSFNLTGKISFIDVGQGDSVLIQLPNNQGNYLIDTGGQLPFTKEAWAQRRKPFTIGSSILTPVLKSKGISTLDKVIITHSDADHMEGLEELQKNIAIKELVFAKGADKKTIMKDTLKAMPKVKQTTVLAGMNWQIGDSTFEYLYPLHAGEGGNNDSLVIKAQLDNKVWLFTGDIEASGEEVLLSQPIKADILKVGHHGSKTSTTKSFIDKVKPTFAIISCGVQNRFGHPHTETLNTLQEAGATIIRTDLQGEITYTFGKGFKTVLK
ncbi:DNA internalization-related competence protein ComEC/Rec2 [Listeria sp. FSL L7-1509]|uniref:DNA internalization-related competence protein ComEC/Rec2 n=3 Tax=Listeria immobilis TaxID=2713502 RepID=A0ABR6SXH9_9LIST|nr:DNA internalization-related competence protein ComEC/Rec2 [Listeria immobilis]MBC1510388.1 DNA internalization-related competence protein ComEC/Rec2 [Listeria immobilis]MBC6303575.1 DNA internalization-related competence protein ComEC/Rec2 [Listeria immobilis]MBC6312911.1 DNA internalization-related competence protein ComEC/Rec2 [Listeria immobilis]